MFELLINPISWLIISGMVYAVLARKLTVSASLTGGILAFLIMFGFGTPGVVLLTAFFILGSAATSWRQLEKQKMDLDESVDGRRSYLQVFANAGVATMSALLALLFPEHQPLLLVMAASSFSAASADTVSSEIGNVYGKRFYNILTFRRDVRGLNGVVSVEGILAGVVASIFIAVLYSLFEGFGNYFYWIIIAGTLGNISDSILGASLERKNILGNNSVNFCNTAIGAIVALGSKLA